MDIEMSGVVTRTTTTTSTQIECGVPKRTLLLWNLAMASFHTALLVVTLVFGNRSLTVPVYRTDLTWVDNGAAAVPRYTMTPSYAESGSMPFTFLVASFFLITALFHAGNATLWRSFYEKELKMCRCPTRWIEYFFSAPIMILVIAYTLGTREVSLLLTISALIAITMPFGWITEKLAIPKSGTEWKDPFLVRAIPHLIGYVPQIAAWIAILLHFYDQAVGPNLPIPWFVHLILWGELILFFSFGFVQVYQQLSQPCQYYKGEILYQILSFASKGLLGLVLLFQVLMLGSFSESLA